MMKVVTHSRVLACSLFLISSWPIDALEISKDYQPSTQALESKKRLKFSNDKLAIGLVNEPYESYLLVEGGIPPYKYSIISNDLPKELSVDNVTGMISGRPMTDGTFVVKAKVSDSRGASIVQSFEVFVTKSQGCASCESGMPVKVSPPIFRKMNKVERQADSVSSLSLTQSLSAPTVNLSNLLQIVSEMGEGEWRRVNLNYYSNVWTPADLRQLYALSNPTPAAIIQCWSGFAWDSNRGNLFLYGGGHANYRGNDTYQWKGETQTWERSSLPSAMIQTPLGYWEAIDGVDKAPASAHTYDNTIFLPILDRVLVLGGAADPNGGFYTTQPTPTTTRITGPYLFDPNQADPNKVGGSTGSHVTRVAPYPEILGGNMWSNRESWLNASLTSAPPVEPLNDSCTGYAEENGKDVVYLRSRYRLYRYLINDINVPAADEWKLVGRFFYGGSGGQAACGYDTVRKLFVSTWDTKAATPFIFWDMNKSNLGNKNLDNLVAPIDLDNSFMNLLSSGQIRLRNCGLDFDPTRNDFKLWCGDGRVWRVTPPATASVNGWTIQKESSVSQFYPTESIDRGIMGRWKYIPNLDVFMGLMDSVQGNIWIYKPVGWVNPAAPDNTPPSVSIISPISGASFNQGEVIELSADATDNDGSIAKVEYYDNNIKIGESTISPFSFNWIPSSAGEHNLTAKAIDNAGGTQVSVPTNVTIIPVFINTPPSLAWLQPLAGSTINTDATINLSVSASDVDGQISNVEFYVDGVKIGEITQAPYELPWTASIIGEHELSATAIDDKGDSTTSVITARVRTPSVTETVMIQRSNNSTMKVSDTYLSAYHTNNNFGASTKVMDQYQKYAPLMRFAIFQSENGPVPNGAHIVSAMLSFYKYSVYNMNYSLHRVLKDWSETSATWNNRMVGMTWTVPGANGLGSDISSTPDASLTIGWNASWMDFDVTAAIQQMSSSPVPNNFGWRLLAVNGYLSGQKEFYTSEAADNNLRPKLIITYQ